MMLRLHLSLLGLVASLAAAVSASGQGILHVDDDAPPAGDGESWDTAYRFLQDALTFAASPRNNIDEIRVAQGVYKPDRDEANPEGSGDREATFNLLSNFTLAGGYAGLGAEDPDARDIELFETILSGDLLGNDEPGFVNYDENSYHVLRANEVDNVTLSGFTVQSGFADGDNLQLQNRGGAIYFFASQIHFESCRFCANAAKAEFMAGGGVAGVSAVSVFDDCVFESNLMDSDVAGGALAVWGDGTFSEINRCLFVGNTSTDSAGAFHVQWSGVAVVRDSVFLNNEADDIGGAVATWGSANTTLINCLFVGNTARRGGGAIYSQNGELNLFNCAIVSNQSLEEPGGGLYMCEVLGLQAQARSCIIWGNTNMIEGQPVNDQVAEDVEGLLKIRHSCVQDIEVEEGTGNIADDPLFVDLLGPDGEPGTGDEDLHLLAGSPCIDAGDNTWVPVDVTTDLDGNRRFVDDPNTKDTGVGRPPIVDMGVYEFQGMISCPWDLDGDHIVGAGDLILLLGSWGDPYGTADLIELLGEWGPCGE